MLLQATLIVTLLAMGTTLWMAFYLFARGYSSRVTLRAIIVLLAVAMVSFLSYANQFNLIRGTTWARASLLTLGLTFWFSLTYRMMPIESRKKWRWMEYGIYGFAAVTLLVLLQPGAFINEVDSSLYIAQTGKTSTNLVYGLFQLTISVCILLNLLVDERVGLTQRGKFFLIASFFPIGSVVYGIVDFFAEFHLPHVIPDLFNFTGIFFLGLSVARHQTLVERRTTYQDLPLSSLAVLGITGLYVVLAWRLGIPVELYASVVGFAVLTHGTYDLTREFLERLRMKNESRFRKQLRTLESDLSGEEALIRRLEDGLALLCRTIQAQGGFAGIRRGDKFILVASQASLPVGSEVPASLLDCEDVARPRTDSLLDLTWIAPSFEGHTQVAVIGIGKPKNKVDYSFGDLELLAEVADQVGTIVSLSNARSQQNEQIRRTVLESEANVNEMDSVASEMMDSISDHPNTEFVKHVEDALRNLPDAIKLGQSPLAEKISVRGDSHVERGKKLQEILTGSIEALKPAEKRPPEPLPRMWYNHAVLYDAYVEGVPNREIMARLYISEGTFNRTRRNAIRGLARLLMEKQTIN
jgi:hypothetical protein